MSSRGPRWRRWGCAAGLLVGLLGARGGWAQEAAPDEAPAPAEEAAPDEATAPERAPEELAAAEIIVWGERQAAARDQLDMSLRRYGYKRVRSRDGWTTYRRTGRQNWKPKVKVNQDGLLVFRDNFMVVNSPFVLEQPANNDPLGGNGASLPERGGLFLMLPMRFPSRRLQGQEKARVLEAIAPELNALTDASAAVAEADLLAALSGRLDALWREGKDPRTGAILATPAERRAALLVLWESRTDNSAGLAAREIIADFLEEVVQHSADHFTDAERDVAAGLGLAISPTAPR